MRSTFLFLAAAVLVCAGCGDSTGTFAGKIGKSCTVRFRRGDALGAGGGNAISPTTDVANGAELNVWGELGSVS